MLYKFVNGDKGPVFRGRWPPVSGREQCHCNVDPEYRVCVIYKHVWIYLFLKWIVAVWYSMVVRLECLEKILKWTLMTKLCLFSFLKNHFLSTTILVLNLTANDHEADCCCGHEFIVKKGCVGVVASQELLKWFFLSFYDPPRARLIGEWLSSKDHLFSWLLIVEARACHSRAQLDDICRGY